MADTLVYLASLRNRLYCYSSIAANMVKTVHIIRHAEVCVLRTSCILIEYYADLQGIGL